MKIDILTLFPDSMSRVLGESIIGRAAKKGIVEINCRQIRDYTDNKQCQVDDYPYGGGWGCVIMAQPVYACLQACLDESPGRRTRVVNMSPVGKRFTQEDAKRLARDYDHIVLVCGHYEGLDERFIDECADEEFSIGDFVLTGGEIPAMAVADAVCRLVPGVLADEECYTGESHWAGLLEYPQYTRPEVWRGRSVPEVLLSGNHADIHRWRAKQSLLRTMERRPDMFEAYEPDELYKKILAEIEAENRVEVQRPVFDVRQAESGDLDAIMEIIENAKLLLKSRGVDQWQDGFPNSKTMSADVSRGECWVFTTCDGRLAGTVTLVMRHEAFYDYIEGEWLNDGAYGSIHRIAVSRDCLGLGLGEEMFSFACELSLGRGLGSVRVDTHPDNRWMRSLAEKCGFTLCGTVFPFTGYEERAAKGLLSEKERAKLIRLGFERILV